MKESKVIVATRTNISGLSDCITALEGMKDYACIECFYVICNKDKEECKVGNKAVHILPDSKPTRPTAFNTVLQALRENSKDSQAHLFTFSKEVMAEEKHIKAMLAKLTGTTLVVGYKLHDNVLSDKEYQIYSNMSQGESGIAYLVPWNTCAIWNSECILAGSSSGLWFDEICESDSNQLGVLKIKIDGQEKETDYKGMEDGLAIAHLLSTDKFKDWKYKLIEGKPPKWIIPDDLGNGAGQRIKMARKNIVLSTFMNIRGYSIERLRQARL